MVSERWLISGDQIQFYMNCFISVRFLWDLQFSNIKHTFFLKKIANFE